MVYLVTLNKEHKMSSEVEDTRSQTVNDEKKV